MKASQDGSNRSVLRGGNIKPLALTIDLVLRKVIWIDDYSKTFSSIDFDGNNFMILCRPKSSSNYRNALMQIFGDNIYWTQDWEKFIFKTKVGVNDTQMDYLMRSKYIEFVSFKIIDASLQPNSTNRRLNHILTIYYML